MRLLKTNQLSGGLDFASFEGDYLPSYAILSHTWSENPDDEVLYADIVSGAGHEKPGWAKIRATCRQARLDGYDYCWVDSCCIDKSSSADLSEAINSMWTYYSGAAKCYAYLGDVSVEEMLATNLALSPFARTKWFTRAWTLQELLAPRNVVFFGREWTNLADDGVDASEDLSVAPIGDKYSLKNEIAYISGISPQILGRDVDVGSASIAERMSWAVSRRSTGTEDIAYSLLGMFDVHMPMIYGEGRKSFFRLQHEILKQSDDPSISAWESNKLPNDYHGLLAGSPATFSNGGKIRPFDGSREAAPWAMSNKGLSLELSMLYNGEETVFLAALQCQHSDMLGFPGIYLKKLKDGKNIYARIRCRQLVQVYKQAPLQAIIIPQTFPKTRLAASEPIQMFQLRNLKYSIKETNSNAYHIESRQSSYVAKEAVYSESRHDIQSVPPLPDVAMSWIEPGVRLAFKVATGIENLSAAILFHRRSDGSKFVLMLGTRTDSEIAFDLSTQTHGSHIHPLESYAAIFNPRPPGVRMSLRHIAVHVIVETQRLPGATYFLLDIHIQGLPKMVESW